MKSADTRKAVVVSVEADAGPIKVGDPVYGDRGEGEYMGTVVEVGPREYGTGDSEDDNDEWGIRRWQCIVDTGIPDPNADPVLEYDEEDDDE